MKNFDKQAKKIPAHNRNWKIFQKEFGIICLYHDFIEDEWFVELGKVEVLSKATRCNSSQNIDCNLKTPPLFSTKIQKLKLSEFGYFLFLCFLLRRKSMRGKVHALVVIKSKLSWVIQIRQTVLGKEST